MATSKGRHEQINMSGLAIKVADLDASGTVDATALKIAGTSVTSSAAELNIVDGVTATADELNYNDLSLATNLMSRGAGVSDAESYAAGVERHGSLITTRIVIDLSTLVASNTDLDIIGEDGAASCHWGQVTAAINGTIIGGMVTCLELPAGGPDDLDFYSATVSTGTEDVDITTLDEVALITSGGAWASGTTKGMTLLPRANDYLYIVAGEASTGTFSAGKFLITLFGVAA